MRPRPDPGRAVGHGGLVAPPARQGPGSLSADAVAALDLAFARRAGGVLPGDHRGTGVGAGTELAQLRPYEPGDDVRQLDPAASARTLVAHVRQHVPERALTTWIVLDVSASMGFGTATRLKSDVAEGVAVVLARLAVRRGGPRRRPRLRRPGGPAAAAARRAPRARLGAAAGRGGRRARTGSATTAAWPTACGACARLAREAGLVVVVSDFRAGGWERALRSLRDRHSVLAVEVGDPREAELPDAGHLVLVDPETGRLVEADTTSARLRARFAAAEAERREALRHDAAPGGRRARRA